MRSQRGFTLMEVMVALLVGSVVVLLADNMFVAVSEAGRSLSDARAAIDREGNARRWLAATFRSISVGAVGDVPFSGDADQLRCTAWLMTPGGWFRPTVVTVSVRDHQLRGALSPGSDIVLADSVVAVRFDYLLERGADTPWAPGWTSPQSPPLAVRMRVLRVRANVVPAQVVADTLLLEIGQRG